MKKFMIFLLMCCCINAYAGKQKTFCFENMCFNAKGWKNIQTGVDEKTNSSFITSAKPVAGGYGGIAVLVIQKTKVPEGMNLNDFTDKRFQETIANYNTSNNTGGTKMQVISQDGLVPFVVNTYSGKSFGVKLRQGIANVYQRIIILEKDGYFYEIQTTSNILNIKSHTKLFVKVLNTMTL